MKRAPAICFTVLAFLWPVLSGAAPLEDAFRDPPPDTEIYFVANPATTDVARVASFRVGVTLPELWWPDSGKIERPAVFDAADGITRLPLSPGPNGSVFVVFRGDSDGVDPVLTVHGTREIRGEGQLSKANIRSLEKLKSDLLVRRMTVLVE